MPRPVPPPGFVHLILIPHDCPFYLEIPTQVVKTVCLYPLKYLRFLGWCVLGVVGDLVNESGDTLQLDGQLIDQGAYQYNIPGGNTLAHAVDLEVIKTRTHTASETTATRNDFRERLSQRDRRCIWTGVEYAEGMHIIPFRRGRDWLQLIIDNRPHEENISPFLDINDIRNGFLTSSTIHTIFDRREAVVLVTPNPILQPTDIPRRHQRNIESDVVYPRLVRYTFQWIVTTMSRSTLAVISDNNDATFAFRTRQSNRPSDLLLHYTYGAAAVKHWGKNSGILTQRPGIPRPAIPAPMQMGPSKLEHDRSNTTRKQVEWTSDDTGVQLTAETKDNGVGAGVGDARKEHDEDDVMLFLWGNTKVARQRHAQKEEERRGYLEQWRSGIQNPADVQDD